MIVSIPFFWKDRLAGSAQNAPDVIRCKSVVADKFVVQGPGETIAAVFTRAAAMPYLAFGPGEKSPLYLAVQADGISTVRFRNRQSDSNMSFTVSPNGDATLLLQRNLSGSNLIMLCAPGRGHPSLGLRDEHQIDRMNIIVNDNGSLVTLADKKKKLRLGLTANPQETGAVLSDDSPRARSTLIDGPNGTVLSFTDRRKTRLALTNAGLRGPKILMDTPDGMKELVPP